MATAENAVQDSPVLQDWLIAVFLFLLLRLIVQVSVLINVLTSLGGEADILLASMAEAMFHILIAIVAVGILIAIVDVGLSIWLLRLFFRASHKFPRMFLTVTFLEVAIGAAFIPLLFAVDPELTAKELAFGSPLLSICVFQYLITAKLPREVFVK